MNVRGRSLLYTVNRPTGDSVGVGLLVHRLTRERATRWRGCPRRSRSAPTPTPPRPPRSACPPARRPAGACAATSSTLSQIGEGSTNPLTLDRNNEDYTALRVAYTLNGIDFHDLGVISGPDPAQDVNNPAATASPQTAGGGPANIPSGQPEPAQLRFVGSRGSIIAGRAGYTMFLSGAWPLARPAAPGPAQLTEE
jgi:hypothetical protein